MKMMYVTFGCIALCAGILQGVTGFGAGILMMLVLPGLFPLNQAAGVSCAVAIALSLSMSIRYRKYFRIRNVVWPALLYMTVSGICICFSTMVNQALMKRMFGAFMILLSIYYLFLNKNEGRELNLPTSIAFVAISGACNGFFAIGGPLMVIFFLGRTSSKEEYLGSIQTVFMVNLVYGTALRVFNHILTLQHMRYVGIGIVCILIGLGIANRIVDRLNGEKIKKVIYIVIGVSGILNVIG